MKIKSLYPMLLSWFDLLVYRLSAPSINRLIRGNPNNALNFKKHLDAWIEKQEFQKAEERGSGVEAEK